MSCQSVEQVTVSGARMWTQRVPKGAASLVLTSANRTDLQQLIEIGPGVSLSWRKQRSSAENANERILVWNYDEDRERRQLVR